MNCDIQILQFNANESTDATESALQFAVENRIDILLIQEPRMIQDNDLDFSNSRSINHSSFVQLHHNTKLRPRVLAYIARHSRFDINISNTSPTESNDMMVLDIVSGRFTCQIVNIYNEASLDRNPDPSISNSNARTLDRVFYPHFEEHSIHANTIILGDFNLHHSWWNPRLQRASPGADKFVDWIDESNFTLLNQIGEGTYHRSDMQSRSILDLTLSTLRLADKIKSWNVTSNLGSDHFGIHFTISDPDLVPNPLFTSGFNTSLANWDLFSSILQSEAPSCPILNSIEFKDLDFDSKSILVDQRLQIELLDLATSEFTNLILLAAESSIPKKKVGPNPKPWWNDNLKRLRQTMNAAQRSLNRCISFESKQHFLISRNDYFAAIKKAKRDHWNQFLEKNDPKSIFKAFSYTSDKKVEKIPQIKSIDPDSTKLESTFAGKCKSFRNILFPPPPTSEPPDWNDFRPRNWEWPKLTSIELRNVCTSKVKGKTPGPDLITQDIISKAYEAIPNYFLQLYSKLIDIGYHPVSWRQATGAILKKPNKPDYSIPKAFRVISLLNCLGKISERVIAQRLGFLAETTSLLHDSQIGSRAKKSAIDAALLLQNEIETNKQSKLKTSTLFVDIRGAFDHVAKNQLLSILHELGLPTSLIAWIFTFLSNRLLRLAFDNNIEDFSEINTGIPQGSPVSPILFLIYIRVLFTSNTIRYISYVDDISLTASSKSYSQNCKILEREIAKMIELASQNAIEFDLSKTELMHFGSKNIQESIQLPDRNIIHPKDLVKWLGIYLDPNLTFKEHVAIKTAKARSNLHRISRIVNISRGLSPSAIRQLYLACIVSIADYGSILWWKGQKGLLKQLQSLQNTACLRILGVFKTSPILAREIESALLPPEIRLNANVRQYALRLQKLSIRHPVNQEIEKNSRNREIESTIFSKALQLDRVRLSISDFIDSDFEKIQHFHFAPWNKDIPYSVTISNSNKDDATNEHLDLINANANSNYDIYTDASSISNPQSQGIGIGFGVFHQNRLIHHSKSNIGSSQLVYNGELEAITQAIEYSSQFAKSNSKSKPNSNSNLKFRVFSDNQAGLLRLKSPGDTPGQGCQIRAIESAKSIVANDASIELLWVPGHSNIFGNELVDELAKEATLEEPLSETTSFAVLGSNIKRKRISEWIEHLEGAKPSTYSKRFGYNPKSKLQIPNSTKREYASAFYQLKIGHGYLKSYLYRFDHSANDKCSCGSRETTEHLLLSCKNLTFARSKLKEKLNSNDLTIKLLLHTQIGIVKTLEFLQETKILTRKWHLERVEREGEEEEEGEDEDDR